MATVQRMGRILTGKLDDHGMIYNERLNQAMREKDMTMKELEIASGLSHYCVHTNVRGIRTPDAHTLGKLADALGVSMDWLWGRTGKR